MGYVLPSMLKKIKSLLSPRRRNVPLLSVVLVCYKMEKQIGNTLRSLVPPYQKKIKKQEYEIILVDNGSPSPLPEEIWKIASNIRYLYIPPGEASPNPGIAINRGVAQSKGRIVCPMIDGARMLSPGVLSWGLRLLDLSPGGLVEVRSWHLGPKYQGESILEGYNHEVETRLLQESQWWENGYRLFEISGPSEQTREGFSGRVPESNCIFMSRGLFDRIGGFNASYKAPGGGFVNQDFFARAVAAASGVFTLLGEGTFHQVHGGAATSLPPPELPEALARWNEESEKIRGPLKAPDSRRFILAGHLPVECRRWVRPERF